MSSPKPTDVEVEIRGRRYVEMSDGTWSEVSERAEPESSHYWDDVNLFHSHPRDIDISPAQAHLFDPIEGAPKAAKGLEEAIRSITPSILSYSKMSSTYGLLSAAAQAKSSYPKLSKLLAEAGEGSEKEGEDAQRQLDEIRSVLKESRRLGEKSERRLEELRQRGG